ncbi:MAG: hypothetical protein ACOYM9_18790 [Bradymonadia bacterium]|jgi:hypothetical protein
MAESVNEKTVVLGDETDEALLATVLDLLEQVGAERVDGFSGVGGSQAVSSATFQLGPASAGEQLVLEVETYMGISVRGPSRWVEYLERGKRPAKSPIYCIVGLRPVKAVCTPEGGLDVLAYDWKTGRFEREMKYLTTLTAPTDEDAEFVDRAAFDAHVADLRAGRP